MAWPHEMRDLRPPLIYRFYADSVEAAPLCSVVVCIAVCATLSSSWFSAGGSGSRAAVPQAVVARRRARARDEALGNLELA
jgi:hypothetical protein